MGGGDVPVFAGDVDLVAAPDQPDRSRSDGQARQVEQVGALLAGVFHMAGDAAGNGSQCHALQRLQLPGGGRAGGKRMAWRGALNGADDAVFMVHRDAEMVEVVFQGCTYFASRRGAP